MKKLLTVLSAVYVFNLTGCTSMDMAEQEKSYQIKTEQERYNKMLGKPTNCQQHPAPTIINANGQKTPNFTYATPMGEPCLP